MPNPLTRVKFQPMTKAATEHILRTCPELAPVVSALPHMPRIRKSAVPVAEAISRIIVSQMLSGTAARAIRSRAIAQAQAKGKSGIWQLHPKTLRACGLSGRKVSAIGAFGRAYDQDPAAFEEWRTYDQDRLFGVVCEHWGLSEWSASMLGIFYFGIEDIFPASDGSIVRALGKMRESGLQVSSEFDARAASPYRSYVALYLWKALDSRVI
jgi:DNA-3-methyladenine glycosylase II